MAVQSWGVSTASNESGAPGVLHVATAPGLARYNVAPILPGPMSTFARMMPVFRPGSPWEVGQLVLRTEEGRLYPVGFGTQLQTFWGTLIFAPPGKGKSFLLNSLNMGLAFSPGLSDLPYITVIDVGMSSTNVVNTLRAMLPESKKHQAVSIRLRNDPAFAINPFDTQLGADAPTERDRDFQVAMISSLSPNLGPEGSRFIGQVIDAAYAEKSRKSLSARKWQRAFDTELSKKIEDLGFELKDNLRVWDVVDFLFDASMIHEATIAQRYAVPTLEHLISAARTNEVKNNFGSAPTPTGELMMDVFTRAITTAVREYALLSTTTKFDLGDARIVAIDLEEIVSSTGSDEGRRRSAIMIMFARQMGAKNYFLKWEEVEPLLPEKYKRYQANRIAKIFETLKFLEYDEFHVAKGITEVQGLAESDIRVGRKYNVVTLLSSQLIEDFTPGMVECATNIFILGTGNAKSAAKLQALFSLSDTELSAITSQCMGPGPKGAPLFGFFNTTKGIVTQILYNSASPLEMWAFTSSALDVAVRKNVAKLRGNNEWEALNLLVRQFPNGSARDEIERHSLNMTDDATADEAGITMTVAKLAISRDLEAQNMAHHKMAA
jgi:intracellular multiplication protein IcmB